jgi:hypothetical protein
MARSLALTGGGEHKASYLIGTQALQRIDELRTPTSSAPPSRGEQPDRCSSPFARPKR